MASEELDWVKRTIAGDRARAGVTTHLYDPAAARASVPETNLPLPSGVMIRQVIANGVTSYWVETPETKSDRVIVYFHGGGFITGGFHSHRSLVCWLAQITGARILFAEYRLAPEHRFPAAVDDCFNVYRSALAEDPAEIFVMGDSAGGALATAVAQLCRDKAVRMPDGAIIACGMMNLDEESSPFLQATQRTRDGVRLYVSHLKDLRNPLASAMEADLQDFPPLLIQTGTDDYCAADCERFARKAEQAGVDVCFENWPDMVHVWHRFAPKLPESLQALDRIAGWLNETRVATHQQPALAGE